MVVQSTADTPEELTRSSEEVDINGTSSQSLPASLEFQLLELGWWVRGECSCDRNAGCQDVVVENRTARYRCICNDGFQGDGFCAGNGCRRGQKYETVKNYATETDKKLRCTAVYVPPATPAVAPAFLEAYEFYSKPILADLSLIFRYWVE
ncbi:wall-associated receptor kinase-like protein 14 [Tanacetum coccineum]